jgi:signal transduction histidine kinase
LESAQAELAEAERKAGILSERQRLAHEIHDTLAQGFISIVIHLEAAEQALAAAEIQTADKHLAQARNTARESLEQARRVVADLQPEPLAQASLPEAITHVVEKWHERCGVTAVTTITGQTQPLPSNIEVTLLRAVQEALANIHKHARASDVQVTLSYMEDVVILDIQDNGVGLNGETAVPDERRGGFGLTAMRERVAQLDGSVLIESEPNEGTTLVVSIPVMRDQ